MMVLALHKPHLPLAPMMILALHKPHLALPLVSFVILGNATRETQDANCKQSLAQGLRVMVLQGKVHHWLSTGAAGKTGRWPAVAAEPEGCTLQGSFRGPL